MTTSIIDIKPSRVFLLGTGTFPKDKHLPTNTLARENLSLMQSVFTNENVFAFPSSDVTSLLDETDHTTIKEKIALAAEQSKGIFYFYYTGQVLLRKGRLHLTTSSSTLAMAYVNGISLDEILEIIKESPAPEKFILLDAQYHKASSEFNFDETQLLAEIFHFYENEYPQVTFLSSHVHTKEHKNFSVCLAAILNKGIEDERPYLSFQDVFEHLTEYLSKEEAPVRSSGKNKRNPIFAPNRRHIDFTKLKRQADIKFDNENFPEALPLYEQILTLFPQNTEVQTRKKFISLLLEVKENIHHANFEKARQLYEQATQILGLGIPKKAVLSSLDKIATMYFERNQYELAREYYELLLKEDNQNTVFKEKYERSRKELLFEQFVEKGDSAYFTYQYPVALENYEQALKIKRDNLVLKRKDECERFIERERRLREELEKQMTEKLFSELKNKVEEQIKSKIEEEMRSKKQEMFGKIEQEIRSEIETSFKQELEDSFWSRVTVWNTIEAYQFYKGFFPNGKYVEKATRRIEELKARQTKTEKPVENVPTSPTPETTKNANSTPASEAKGKETSVPTTPKPPTDTTEHKATRIRLGDIIHREDVKNVISSTDKKEEVEKEEEILPTTDAILAKNKQEASKKEEKSPKEEVSLKPTKDEPNFATMTDKQLWEYAKSKGSIRAYMDYIENTKEYTYVSDAYFEINQLKRKGYTLENDVKTPFQTSASPTNKEQEARFASMSEEELWRYAQRENTLEAYRVYVEYTKEAQHVADAYYFINQLTKDNQPDKKEEAKETPLTTSTVAAGETPQQTAEIAEIEQSPEIKASLEALEEALRNFRQEDYMPKKKQPAPPQEETFGFSEAEIQRIKRMTEDELWVWAQTKNSIEAYRAYVEYTREATHVADAYFLINQLMHQNEIEPISVPFTSSSSYESFSTTSSSYVDIPTIETGTASKEEEELWRKAQAENTIGGYFNYMNATTEKKYWDEAKRRINELKGTSHSQEQLDWEQAQREDTIEAYRSYIRKYPLGNNYAKAMFRINKLEADLNN